MNTIDEQIAILQAYKAGKPIKYRERDEYNNWEEWRYIDYHQLDFRFNFNDCEYRIDDTIGYRPYSGALEFGEDRSHFHGAFVRHKERVDVYYAVTCFSDRGVTLNATDLVGYEGLLNGYVWANDGTPCGVKIED